VTDIWPIKSPWIILNGTIVSGFVPTRYSGDYGDTKRSMYIQLGGFINKRLLNNSKTWDFVTASCGLQIKKVLGWNHPTFWQPFAIYCPEIMSDSHLLVITKLNFVTAIPTRCRTFWPSTLIFDPHQIDITSWRLQPVFFSKA